MMLVQRKVQEAQAAEQAAADRFDRTAMGSKEFYETYRLWSQAERELDIAQAAFAKAQQQSTASATVLNGFASTDFAAEIISTTIDGAFRGTGINYCPSLISAQSAARAGMAALFGLDALRNFENTFGEATNNIFASSNLGGYTQSSSFGNNPTSGVSWDISPYTDSSGPLVSSSSDNFSTQTQENPGSISYQNFDNYSSQNNSMQGNAFSSDTQGVPSNDSNQSGDNNQSGGNVTYSASAWSGPSNQDASDLTQGSNLSATTNTGNSAPNSISCDYSQSSIGSTSSSVDNSATSSAASIDSSQSNSVGSNSSANNSTSSNVQNSSSTSNAQNNTSKSNQRVKLTMNLARVNQRVCSVFNPYNTGTIKVVHFNRCKVKVQWDSRLHSEVPCGSLYLI